MCATSHSLEKALNKKLSVIIQIINHFSLLINIAYLRVSPWPLSPDMQMADIVS